MTPLTWTLLILLGFALVYVFARGQGGIRRSANVDGHGRTAASTSGANDTPAHAGHKHRGGCC